MIACICHHLTKRYVCYRCLYSLNCMRRNLYLLPFSFMHFSSFWGISQSGKTFSIKLLVQSLHYNYCDVLPSEMLRCLLLHLIHLLDYSSCVLLFWTCFNVYQSFVCNKYICSWNAYSAFRFKFVTAPPRTCVFIPKHPASGYKNSIECLNTSVPEESAGWLLSTRTQPISKLRLVTVVTEF